MELSKEKVADPDGEVKKFLQRRRLDNNDLQLLFAMVTGRSQDLLIEEDE